MNTTVAIPEKEIGAKQNQMSLIVRSIQVIDNASRAKMIEALQTIKALRKEIADTWNPRIQEANSLHRNLIKDRDKYDKPLEADERYGKSLIASWETAQEQKQRAIEAELRQAAIKQEQQRRIETAAILEKAGEQSKGMALINEPVRHVPIVMPQLVEKVSGSSSSNKWKGDIPDPRNPDQRDRFMELVQAVAKGEVPILALLPNTTFINQQITGMKDLFSYPGVTVAPDKQISIKAAE